MGNEVYILEDLVIVFPVRHVGARHHRRILRAASVDIGQRYEPILIWVREWTEKDSIDNAKNRSCTTDPDREGKNCDQSKT
jgi:hypothetical protein